MINPSVTSRDGSFLEFQSFGPEGHHMKAQGNALGQGDLQELPALKGHNNLIIFPGNATPTGDQFQPERREDWTMVFHLWMR
jgi:hypothetical protein